MDDTGSDSRTRRAGAEALFRDLAPALVGFLSRRLRDRAEAQDLAQEAYLRLLDVSEETLIENPKAYMFRIASNLAAQTASSRARRPDLPSLDAVDEDRLGDGGAFEQLIEARASMSRLETILERMPAAHREALLLRKRDGYSHQEIAERLDVSPHTVHKYLKRAVARCRAEWTEEI